MDIVGAIRWWQPTPKLKHRRFENGMNIFHKAYIQEDEFPFGTVYVQGLCQFQGIFRVPINLLNAPLTLSTIFAGSHRCCKRSSSSRLAGRVFQGFHLVCRCFGAGGPQWPVLIRMVPMTNINCDELRLALTPLRLHGFS